MEICLIWIHAAKQAADANGDLIWHGATDARFFRELALEHPVVMDESLWQSLPAALPGRQNIVLSKEKGDFKGAVHCESLPEALSLVSVLKPAKVLVIGGETMDERLLNIADRLYVARIGSDGEGSAPHIDPRRFALSFRTARVREDKIPIVLEEYKRLRLPH